MDFEPLTDDPSVDATGAGNFELGDLGYALWDKETTRGVAVSPPTQPFFLDAAPTLAYGRDIIMTRMAANSRAGFATTKGLQKPAGGLAGPLVMNGGLGLWELLMGCVRVTGNDKVASGTPDAITSSASNANAGTCTITFSAPSTQRYRPGAPVIIDCTTDGAAQSTSILGHVIDMTVNTTHNSSPSYDYNQVLTITVPYTSRNLSGLKVCMASANRYTFAPGGISLPTATIELVYGGLYGDVFAGVVGSKLTLAVDSKMWHQTWDLVGTQPVVSDPSTALTGVFNSTASQLRDFLQTFPGALSAIVAPQDTAATGTAALGLLPNWESLNIEIDNGALTLERGGRQAHNAIPGQAKVTWKHKYDNVAKRRIERDEFLEAVTWMKTTSLFSQALIPALVLSSGQLAGVTGVVFYIPAAQILPDTLTTGLAALSSIETEMQASPVASQPVWGEWAQVHTSPDHWRVTANGSTTVKDASINLPLIEAWTISTATAAP